MSGPNEIEELRAQVALAKTTIEALSKTVSALAAKNEMLEGLVLRLTEELSRNSQNSNKPPSSDAPGGGAPRRNGPRGKRGGQKGHRGSHRALIAPEGVAHVIHMFPARCDSCHERLPRTQSLRPKRHQQTDRKSTRLNSSHVKISYAVF